MRATANRSELYCYASNTDARMLANKHTNMERSAHRGSADPKTNKHTCAAHQRAHSAVRAASVERRAPPPHAEARRRHEVDVCSAHKTRESPAELQEAVKSPAASCRHANRAKWCGAPKSAAVPVQRGSRGGRSRCRCGRGGIGRTEVYDLDGGRDTCQRVRPSHLSAQQATQHATANKQTNKQTTERPTRTKETMREQASKQTNRRTSQMSRKDRTTFGRNATAGRGAPCQVRTGGRTAPPTRATQQATRRSAR